MTSARAQDGLAQDDSAQDDSAQDGAARHGPARDLDISRRRAVAGSSARSLLLTVLGEFVFPTGEPVWTAALVDALDELGIEPKTARQALARTAGEGLIVADRIGRRVRWSLTDAGRRLLAEGTSRIYGFMQGQPRWDGRWLVLTVTVPETQRQLRHRLRTRLTWAGLGSPSPGLWVVPDAGKDGEVAGIIAELGIRAHAHCWVGPSGSVGDEQHLVADAWLLQEVEESYADFVSAFSPVAGAQDEDAFRSQVLLVHDWRRFPFLDPGLPPALLDHDWPGPKAAQLFRNQHDHWHERAQQHWTALCRAAAVRA